MSEYKAVVWAVITSKKGGYQMHSVHKSREVAEQWLACILHGGEDDGSILELDQDSINHVSELK